MAAKKTTTKKKAPAKAIATKAVPKRGSRTAAVEVHGEVLTGEGSDGVIALSHGGMNAALVIVESPAKAKTIEKYLKELGTFHVEASKGHIRDLPERAVKIKDPAVKTVRKVTKKGEKKEPAAPKPMDIPGVDMETFATTYVVTPDRKETVSKLLRLRKGASEIWFATDLDREGEAISWHIAEVLKVDPLKAKRVVFNAITKSAIKEAFEHPRAIDMPRVNAQNSRRILDRIVGYGISPLLWRMMRQGGLSAGRVQTVAARLVVEREEEIREFIPAEKWEVLVRLTPDQAQRNALSKALASYLASSDSGRTPSQKERVSWCSKNKVLEAQLVGVGGKSFAVDAPASLTAPKDLSKAIESAVVAAGLDGVTIATRIEPRGKGAARFIRTVTGTVGATVTYRVATVKTEPKSRRPMPPFKTSTLQMAASSERGFSTDRTMRIAQQLYEGVDLGGDRVGLITYMRTDSTNLAPEAIHSARDYIKTEYGADYLPEKPNYYASGKDAQEAHEAIRPTDAWRTPQSVRPFVTSEQYELYDLIWRRFVGCQMAPKTYDLTTVNFERSDRPTGAIVRASGSVVTFQGYNKLVDDISEDDAEAVFPALQAKQELAAISVDALQKFTSPPSRYNEASLVKELEARGIGRPSTYASIVNTIAARGYVEQKARRFHATALGEAVVSLLIGGFPLLFDYEYTRRMEERLDRVESNTEDWREILREVKAKLEGDTLDACFTRMREVPLWRWTKYACPKCGKRARERVGGGRWFLSCSDYPNCDFASRLNDEGEPVSDVSLDMTCPIDGSAMVLRSGKFGKYISSVNYPTIKFVVRLDKKDQIILPAAPPMQDPDIVCAKCGKLCNIRDGKRGVWLGCSGFPKCRGRGDWKALGEAKQLAVTQALAAHSHANAPAVLCRRDGSAIAAGTPSRDLILPESVVVLPIHPEPIPTDSGAESPYRAAERIAEPFVHELRIAASKRKASASSDADA